MRTVAAVRSIDPDELSETELRRLAHGDAPVRLTGLACRWPAYLKWSLSRIEQDFGETQIQLEVGNVAQDGTELETCRLKDYLATLSTSRDYTIDSLPPIRNQKTKYLSIFSLSRHAPSMLDDIDFRFFEARRTNLAKVAWIGPSLTVSGWHYDWKDNLFAQISGRKVFHLAAPEHSAGLYPSRKYDPYSTLSKVSHDPFRDEFDRTRFPAFAGVPLIRADLAAGDVLYVPRRYWHHVTSLTTSISVSMFGSTPLQGAAIYLREKLRAGLFRTGWHRESTVLKEA